MTYYMFLVAAVEDMFIVLQNIHTLARFLVQHLMKQVCFHSMLSYHIQYRTVILGKNFQFQDRSKLRFAAAAGLLFFCTARIDKVFVAAMTEVLWEWRGAECESECMPVKTCWITASLNQ